MTLVLMRVECSNTEQQRSKCHNFSMKQCESCMTNFPIFQTPNEHANWLGVFQTLNVFDHFGCTTFQTAFAFLSLNHVTGRKQGRI